MHDTTERDHPMDAKEMNRGAVPAPGAESPETERCLAVTITRHTSGLAAVVHLEGHLDQDTVSTFRQKVAPLYAQRLRVLAFDMARLQFIASAGVGALVYARRAQTAGGGIVRLVNLPPRIRRVFEVLDALPPNTVFADAHELDRYLAAVQRGESDAHDAPTDTPREIRVKAS